MVSLLLIGTGIALGLALAALVFWLAFRNGGGVNLPW